MLATHRTDSKVSLAVTFPLVHTQEGGVELGKQRMREVCQQAAGQPLESVLV